MITRTVLRIVTMVTGFALLLGATTASAQAADGEESLTWYLTQARTAGRPIFFAECGYDVGKIMVIVPLGDVTGFFVNVSWGAPGQRAHPVLETSGKFELAPRIEVYELAHGGPHTARLLGQNVEKLLARPVRMIRPEKFASLMGSKPTIPCDREVRRQ